MSGLPITFACGLYDRMLALHTGEVKPDGIDLNFLAIDHPREIFDRMANNLEFDAAEMSSSDYFRHAARGDCPMVAIPVFPSRVFRHGYIAIDKRVIREPKDLAGKRIGVPLYAMTAAIVIRGLLQHDYGVDLSGVTWVEGGMNDTKPHGAPSTIPLVRPVKLELHTDKMSLNDRLESGDIAAVIGSGLPKSVKTNPNIARLFPDYRESEIEYYRKTKIFPIMHLVVLRRDALREASVRGDQPLQRLLRRQGDRAIARCASSARCATCCRGWRRSSRRSSRCSAAIPGPTASTPTGRRSTRWCSISPTRR